jgi:formate dehydrogenase major subunit
VAGLATSLGSGAMTNEISELGGASAILAIGTNTTAAHPIVALQVKDAVRRKGAKLIVVNPKEIELCKFADVFLQLNPGSDLVLLMGMMRVILKEGLHDKSFIESRCEGFEDFEKSLADFDLNAVKKITGISLEKIIKPPRIYAFEKSLADFDLDIVEKITGVPREKIIKAARIYATATPASIIYCMGITQHVHGTDNVLAISNLALLTGNIGKASSGINPLRGQNNVQGACDMGCLPNVYPGYQAVTSAEAKEKFESAWGAQLSSAPGLTHTEIFDAIHDGSIRALYLVGENPVLSEANASHATEAMKKAEFLVVQDIFLTQTAMLADVILPATTFAEKDGTFTNTERRVQRVRKAIDPVGGSKPDWWITCQLAKRLGDKGFDFSSPAQIMEEISSLVPSYKGISYARLEKGAIQWPCPSMDHPGTPFLHADKFSTDTGKGKFKPLAYRKPGEVTDGEYPLLLTTDRRLFHFHSTMTRRVYGLNILGTEELLNIHPEDASRLGLADGQMVRVTSRRGEVKVKVRVEDTCLPGTVSMTFHFSETPTNVLTCCELDPVSKTPGTKVCAVRIEGL